jgi:ankyrin repeat protein
VSSGPAGEFRIDNLQTGIYQLRIEAPGFAALEGEHLFVQPDSEVRAERKLAIAEITELINQEVIQLGGMVAFVGPEDPFISAAQDDEMETFTALIAGRDVNLRDKRSHTTALEHAVRNGNREMVQLLLDAGAKVNAPNEAGEVVLMMLSGESTSDLVWDLINAGADVNVKDLNGNTALIRISDADSLEAVKTLIDAGAKVNEKNKQGRTALMEAASAGLVNTVRALVLAGADINAKDEDEMTALSLAVENSHSAVIRFLRSKGATEPTRSRVKNERPVE